jgi:competence protein ComEC
MRHLVAVLVTLLVVCVPTAAQVRIHFVDVGQGDAILIQAPSGQNVLYDGGQGVTQISEYLDSVGVTSIDLVVASHLHADHIGGLAAVVQRFRPKYYLDNGIATTTLTYQRLLQAVQRAGSAVLEPTARQISLGEVTLQILAPPGVTSWEQNNNSIGIMVQYGAFRLSLGGDAEPREWTYWTERFPDYLRAVHVHKASHHGAQTGDTQAALGMLTPKAVVISVGATNTYGHPTAATLALYAHHNSTVYRTDQNGTIIVEGQKAGAFAILPARRTQARVDACASAAPIWRYCSLPLLRAWLGAPSRFSSPWDSTGLVLLLLAGWPRSIFDY